MLPREKEAKRLKMKINKVLNKDRLIENFHSEKCLKSATVAERINNYLSNLN